MASRFLLTASKAITAGGVGAVATVAAYRYQEVQREQSKLPTNELWSFKSNPTDGKKNVIIVGGGVVGITAAYKAALKGHKVVLLEPRSLPGKECSACAAGGMQRSNPVVDKGTWKAVTKSFLPFTRLVFGGSSEPYKFFHVRIVVIGDRCTLQIRRFVSQHLITLFVFSCTLL